MAFTLIAGTAVGTVLTLVFLPALYAIWFRVHPDAPQAQQDIREDQVDEALPSSSVIMFERGKPCSPYRLPPPSVKREASH